MHACGCRAADLLRCLKAVHDRHGDVHEDHVRVDGKREVHRLRSIPGVAHDLEPFIRRQDRLEGLPEQAVVVRDQHADPLWHVDGGLHDAVPLSM